MIPGISKVIAQNRKPLAFIRSLGDEQPTKEKCAEIVTTDGLGHLHVVPVSATHLLNLIRVGTEMLSQKGVIYSDEE